MVDGVRRALDWRMVVMLGMLEDSLQVRHLIWVIRGVLYVYEYDWAFGRPEVGMSDGRNADDANTTLSSCTWTLLYRLIHKLQTSLVKLFIGFRSDSGHVKSDAVVGGPEVSIAALLFSISGPL